VGLPLCFNLFGELAEDNALATTVFRALLPARVHEVDEVIASTENRSDRGSGRRSRSSLGWRTTSNFVASTRRGCSRCTAIS